MYTSEILGRENQPQGWEIPMLPTFNQIPAWGQDYMYDGVQSIAVDGWTTVTQLYKSEHPCIRTTIKHPVWLCPSVPSHAPVPPSFSTLQIGEPGGEATSVLGNLLISWFPGVYEHWVSVWMYMYNVLCTSLVVDWSQFLESDVIADPHSNFTPLCPNK